MTTDLDCADPLTWQIFLLGRMADQEAQVLEQHLTRVPRCRAVVESTPAEDSLVRAMKSRSPILAGPERPAIDRLIAQLRSLPTTVANAADHTIPPQSSSL